MDIKAKDIHKNVRQLMDALFTKKEMAQSCLIKTSKAIKPALPADKVKLIEGTNINIAQTTIIIFLSTCILECIETHWGEGSWLKNIEKIRISGNQKCLDYAKSLRIDDSATKSTNDYD